MQLIKFPWRDVRPAADADTARRMASQGTACRLVLSGAVEQSYVRPFRADGPTREAGQFAGAVFGPTRYWAADLEAIFLPRSALITRSSLLLPFGDSACDELDYDNDVLGNVGLTHGAKGMLRLEEALASRLSLAPVVPGATLVMQPKYHENHYHWHTEGVSQLSAIPLIAAALDQVAVPGGNEIQAATLAVSPVANALLPLSEPAYRFETAVLLSHALFRTWIHPSAAAGLQAFGDAARARHAPEVQQRRPVYLARTDAKARSMQNEDELCAMLSAEGFEIFVASGASYADQVRAFARASLLVSPHGAGLANLIYTPPGTPVVELRPMHTATRSPFWHKSMWVLAGLCDRPFGAAVFPNSPYSDDWRCDLPWLKDFLRSVTDRHVRL